MKITVGKAYEGGSNFNKLPDGTYVFQIVNIEQTKGRVNMQFITSSKQSVYKTFFLIGKDGKTSDRAMKELADFVTTAMQIEDDECQVDIGDALGCYVQAEIKNSSYKNPEGLMKSVVYVNRPARADGFPDGTDSLLEEVQGRRRSRTAKLEAAEVSETEETAEDDTDTTTDFLSSLGV